MVEVNTGGSQPLDTGQNSSSHVPLRPRQQHTDAELDDMRRNKICFKCKGPFYKGHPCSKRELQVLTVINGFPMEVLDQDLGELQEENNKLIGDLMEFSPHYA
ncbi:unnamed protein product [Microthlaspi erraticum]|uniref:Uncharacterized protein n=1 Tax=Microthlaspi erraticum TaxID=1685480 RepID=A0A6D2J089_9BRAS|nr:unnamed protein product [Microthlaspi erraticum]